MESHVSLCSPNNFKGHTHKMFRPFCQKIFSDSELALYMQVLFYQNWKISNTNFNSLMDL